MVYQKVVGFLVTSFGLNFQFGSKKTFYTFFPKSGDLLILNFNLVAA